MFESRAMRVAVAVAHRLPTYTMSFRNLSVREKQNVILGTALVSALAAIGVGIKVSTLDEKFLRRKSGRI